MMQPTPAPTTPPRSPQQTQGNDQRETEAYPPPPQNTGSAPFSILVALFEKLQIERKHDRRRRLLETWFTHWRTEKGYDLYPVLRLILPQKDRERAIYGLKEKNLAKTYIKLIPLGMRDPDAIRLLNWKKPTEKYAASGDFPAVLYDVVSKRSSVIEGSLTIDDLNETLDQLSKNMGKQDVQSSILQRVYNRSTPEEQRWIVRIILKDMNISVKETTLFSVFHPDAQDLYNTCSDLKKVAWELWDPSYRLDAENKAVQLFHAFAPMLCKRPTRTIEETVKEMGGSEFFIDEKLDGERMQIHKRGNEYFYCSRKGKDYTYLYGKHVGTGSLTPYIDSAFDPRVDSIILDGEMLVWDPVTERLLPFGTLKTAALDKTKKEHNPRPCFKVFDLLYLNGKSILHRSLTFRRRNLQQCLKEVPGRLEFTAEFRGKTPKDIRTRMDEIMASRGEGLIIKHPSSKYVLNGRNMDWIKVKPEYMDNMGETVDVLVVAGQYGSGKRGGGVSTLICAVLEDRQPETEDEEPKYSTFIRIGSGLSFADYVWIRDKPWKPWDPKTPPDFLRTSKRSQDDKGDVYLEPQDSFLLKVKAAEIIPSDQYHLGFTMRFPRAMSIRHDLSIADCMSATSVLESVRGEKKRKMESDVGPIKKKRKLPPKKTSILPQYQGPGLRKVDVKSNIFEGLTFVVISDPKSRTSGEDRIDLMKLVRSYGGTCAQIARDQPDLIIIYDGSAIPYDLKLIIDKGKYDVVRSSWIEDSISLGRCAPFRKRYFFHATEARMASEDYGVEGEEEIERQRDSSPSVEEFTETTPKRSAAMGGWLDLGTGAELDTKSDSETEPDEDSDNEDVRDAGNEPEADEDLFQMPSMTTTEESPVEIQMGETTDAAEYDMEFVFRHLCFYLDTPENARKNRMTVKTKQEKAISETFSDISKSIIANGGKIVDLDNPKLTHIVLDKRDDSRRISLMQYTSKPRRRHLVISDYIQACLDEGTLLDEDVFAP
ncbi:DNA ligase 4 [Amanita rubescens]|nr:DNA ligase 4 [Amanita rubescens]